MKPKLLKLAAAVGMLLLFAGPYGLERAMATGPTDPTVPTTATVNGGAVAPNIECKWELPNMNTTNPSGTMVYNGDDDPVAPAPVPCDLKRDATGAATGTPVMANNVHHMIQVNAPNHVIGNAIPERNIELWAAVDHPSGLAAISDVYWDVYQPAAGSTWSLKTEVHYDSPSALQNDGHGSSQGLGMVNYSTTPGCTGFGNSSTAGTMFNSAVSTGQLTSAAVDDTTWGMIARCQQQVKGFFHAQFQLDKDEPCGEYKVVATAVAVGGNFTQLTNYLDVYCNVYLQLDFNAVNWGTIIPGITAVDPGDLVWNTPIGANPPTVANGNNDGLGVKVSFSTMTGATNGKTISNFDACFGRSPSTLYCVNPIPAGTTTDLTTQSPAPPSALNPDPAQVLCANEFGKLDLSVEPPSTLPNDTYTGTVTIIGYHVPNYCLGNAHSQ